MEELKYTPGKRSYKSIRIFLLITLCFLSIQPWIIWGYTIILPFISLLYIYLVCITILKRLAYSLLPFLLIVYMLIPRTGEIVSLKVALIISLSFITFLMHEEEDVKVIVYKRFRNLFSILLVPGIFLYLLHYVVKLPFFIIPSRNLVLVQEYRNYFFFLEAVQDVDKLPRFRFIFDEAGVVGTICFYVLLFERYEMKGWKNKVILLGGLLSFSLFFYVGTFIMFTMVSSITNVRRFIILTSIMAVLVVVLSTNEVFNTLIYSRVTSTSDLLGEERTQEVFNNHFDKYIQTDKVYLGNGMGSEFALEERDAAIASYKTYIYEYGYVGVLLLVVIYYILVRRQINRINSIIVVAALVLCWFQRPWIFDYYNTILIFCGIYIIRDKINAKKLLKQQRRDELSDKQIAVMS